jgi:hypothetical protein
MDSYGLEWRKSTRRYFLRKRQIARLGQLAFLCDTLKDTKKLVVF